MLTACPSKSQTRRKCARPNSFPPHAPARIVKRPSARALIWLICWIMRSGTSISRIPPSILASQMLLWSLRTGLLREEVHPDLTLYADHFDEEWMWIGSHATWRAAMFVLLYPENVLLPSLRRHQTPAFRELASELRSNPRLTPEQACHIASCYAAYFEDVSKMQVEATCQARANVHIGDCYTRERKIDKVLFFMFGRGPKTNRLYWSYLHPENSSGFAQTF